VPLSNAGTGPGLAPYPARTAGVPLVETLVMERDEKSPYRGFALVFALGAGVSIWIGLISVMLRVIS
jgi:hypothetical protein